MTFFPITRNHSIAPILIVSSLLVAGLQTYIGSADNFGALWCNVGASALLSACLWDMVSRYHFTGTHSNYAFMLGMVLLPAATNIPLLNFGEKISPALDGGPQGLLPSWMVLVAMVALVLQFFLAFAAWQRHMAVVLFTCSGILLGGLSMLHSHFLYWIFLYPILFYHSRCFSWRNFWSALTGVLFGIWIVYIVAFLCQREVADALVLRIPTTLFQFENVDLNSYGGWPLFYLACFTIPTLLLSLTGFLPTVGESIRTHDGMALVGSVGILMLILALFDGAWLPVYMGVLSLILTLQMAIRLSTLQSIANEWWSLFYLILMLLLGFLPLIVAPLRGLWTVMMNWLS